MQSALLRATHSDLETSFFPGIASFFGKKRCEQKNATAQDVFALNIREHLVL